MLHSGGVSPNAKMREFVAPDWVDLKDSARVAQNLLARPGDSALHLAVAHGRVELVRLLVEAGGDVYATNKAGQTPLEVACEKGFVSAVRALLDVLPAFDARALVLYQEVGQRDALSVARRYDSDEVVRLLIGYDADGSGGRFYSTQRLQDEVLRAVYSRSAGSFVELANATGFDPTSKVDGESLLSHFSGAGKEVVKEYQTNYRFMKRMRDVNTRIGAVFDGGVAVDEGDAPVNRRRGPSL